MPLCYNSIGDTMRIPNFLKKGDTIGLIAPSFGANIEPYKTRLEHAIKKITDMGYKFKFDSSVFEYQFGASSPKEARAKQFMDLYTDDEVSFLWSVGGGEWMMEMIPLIDFEYLKTFKPKYVMGYSDNTHLTFLMNTLLDTVSIYGQNITEFGMREWDQSLIEAFEIITGNRLTQETYPLYEDKNAVSEDPLSSYTLVNKTSWNTNQLDEQFFIEGRLIGGCLDILTLYPGLKYDKVSLFNETYQKDGIIWFLEACDLTVFGIKRALWQLKEAGWFNHLKGIIFGRPLNGDPIIDITQYNLVNDLFKDYDIPIIFDMDFGHIAPTFTILSGAKARITYNNHQGRIEYIVKE